MDEQTTIVPLVSGAMTSSSVESPGQQTSPVGTVSVMPFAGEPSPDEPGTPYLLVYSLGDGPDGPEATATAMRAMLRGAGLSLGERLTDLAEETRIASSLLVEAERAVLSLPFLRIQCPVPSDWERAAHESGSVYLICATRPWPEAAPGRPLAEERVRAFVGDRAMLAESAHARIPVRRVRT
ncbi:DUF5949 family protein [Streptomyces sp. LP05-1]|uniref:DUF5949 family protein n=1 Tax=Streptomyces pyxinae TaxID=2970734 RepID=A0ABT2CQL6_9ACTN|nr:DUF5949 family protein [Streptomyces sp. LP05-1]MCS0638971.1 DUF5949 family protein [Streptomyces sp. LP05-1]